MEISASSRRILAGLLESRTGQQLGSGRRWRVDTALAPILRDGGFENVDQLVSRIASGQAPALAERAIEALLNNETYFYRDRLPFDLLMAGPLKRLEAARAGTKRISIWSVGCSTGQELYSMAMAFAEQGTRWRGWTIDLVGSDISRSAIERARAGSYSQFEVQRGLPINLLLKYFTQVGDQWQIAPAIRALVDYKPLNLIKDFSQLGSFDIIFCRNVLIYFDTPTKGEVLKRMACALPDDGALLLGAAETVIGITDALIPHPEHRGLYVPHRPAAVQTPAPLRVAAGR